MNYSEELSTDQLSQILSYAGFILLSFELVKGLIIKPIKEFYANTTFGEGVPFNTYETDVDSRHKYELEACLMYLRDFMEALDSDDVTTIQTFRKHRNEIAHELPHLIGFNPEKKIELLKKVDKALFKLSNYNTYIQIGADPQFKDKGIDWDTIYGAEYALFKSVINNVENLKFVKNV